MKVCKFGGSSLADAAQIRKICDIVLADSERRIMVVSAPGKRNKQDIKVTDMLIACAEKKLSGGNPAPETKAIINRFQEICRDLDLPVHVMKEIVAGFTKKINGDVNQRGRYLDAMKATGEDCSARIVAAELLKRGAKARYMNPGEAGMILTDEFGNAQLLKSSPKKLAKLAKYNGITVFPGFFGYTQNGEIATFPRGGSDITGSILAAAVKADLYENFTDVDAVYCVDPAIVPHPEPISEMSYREMRELSYAGFSVLHEEAIIPTATAGIPICIKNTNSPSMPGTKIVPRRTNGTGRVVGIASDEGFCTLYVEKYLMNREIGFGRKVLNVLEKERVSYEHMPSGIDNLSIIIREKRFDQTIETRTLNAIRNKVKADNVSVERGLALIMLVGEGMRFTVGLASRATTALAKANVNIEMINQGSSEISIMFGVKSADRKKAVASLYNAFFGS